MKKSTGEFAYFAAFVKQRRMAMGFRWARDLAKEIGVSQTTISTIETGKQDPAALLPDTDRRRHKDDPEEEERGEKGES